MSESSITDVWNKRGLLLAILIILFSYFTYFHNYQNPPDLFWDENYHLASAQKYLNQVYFMEQHPPFGKLIIALGEKIMDANPVDDDFIGTDYGKDLPDGFSYVGYRLFPTLFGWLLAPLIFFIFLVLSKRPLISALLTFPYIFDNALIVHLRGAMLEPPLLFFSAAMILLWLLLGESTKKPVRFGLLSFLFGISFGLALTTKVVGLLMILLFPILFWQLRSNRSNVMKFFSLSMLGFLIAYVSVWQIHFSLGKNINESLSNEGYYEASERYKELIKEGKTSFPIMLKDSIKFVGHYNDGVPTLDLCKEVENGSPAFFWPTGSRAISYRWATPDGLHTKYLYLVANPVSWLVGLIGVIFATILVVGSYLLPTQKKMKYRFYMQVILFLYFSYMIAILQLDRVMYLYHYFIPLLFSFILFGLVVMEIQMIGKFKITEHGRALTLLSIAALIFVSFHFYRPLTYYEPITDEAFQKRVIFPLWEMKCANCDRESILVKPRKEDKEEKD